MKFHYLIDCIVFIASASLFTSKVVRDEYIYQTVSESYNFTANHSFQYCTPNETKSSDKEKTVADEVSRWSIYINLAEGLPAIITSVFLTSWSDKVGRKLPIAITLLGSAILALSQIFVIHFKWPFIILVVNSLIYGITGSFPTLLNISMAYLSDVTEKEEKLKRFTIVECAMGLGGGLTAFVTGYWIRADGFIPTSYLSAGCGVVALVLVPFLTKSGAEGCRKSHCSETINAGVEGDLLICGSKQNGGPVEHRQSVFVAKSDSTFVSRLKVTVRIYTSNQSFCDFCESGQKGLKCEHGGGERRGRVWRLWFFVFAFFFYLYTSFGTSTFTTMYFSAYPLCFSPVLIGAHTAVRYGSLVLSPLVVKVCKSFLKLSEQSVLVLAVAMTIVSTVTIGFAKVAFVVFIASGLYVINNISAPAMRSQVSSLVSATEQGAAMSLISSVEALCNMIGTMTYLLIYPATLHIYFGFAWLYTAAMTCIPLALMMAVWIADRRRVTNLEGEREHLINT